MNLAVPQAGKKKSIAVFHNCIQSFKRIVVQPNMDPSNDGHTLAVLRYEGGFGWDTSGLTVNFHVGEQSYPHTRTNLKTR